MPLLDLHRYSNPRSLWGAMSGSPGRRGRWYISIRAPRVGSDDLIRDEVTLGGVISIRTPRVGSDSTKRCKVLPCLHFNPHSPRGERFSSPLFLLGFIFVSIRTPRVGSNLGRWKKLRLLHYFNPHSPRGEQWQKPTRIPCKFLHKNKKHL